jgi:protein ImuB
MGDAKMTELYVCVHVPEFPAQALVRLRPSLTRSPVVVLQGDAPLEQVCSVNSRAVRLGVRHAMTRVELDSFTGLKVLRRSFAEERSARNALLNAAGRFSPRIEVQTSTGAAWAMALDMAGSTSMFGPVGQFIRLIERAMKALGFSVRVAASGNLRAAVCIAPSAVRAPIVIPHCDESKCLANLPLATLGLTPQQSDTFALWGLHTLGELAALPEVDLIVRLGQEGKRLRLLASGEHPHLMVPEEAAFSLEEFLELDAPVELLDSLLFVLGPMLEQLIIRAQSHAFALANVTVRLGLDGGGEHQRTIRPALPIANRELLLKLLHLDLQAHPPTSGVVSLFVTAEPGERGKVQLGLWSPQLPEPMRLDITLARIAALVGEERVGYPTLDDSHKPESFRMKRFLVPTSSGESMPRPKHSAALRRYRPPVTIRTRRDGGRLSAFYLHGTLYTVEQAYGPWRKSGDWWSSQVWSYEEWDVQAMTHSSIQPETLICVISYDLLRKEWQLVGLYD